jgi:hypothetical protein
VELPEQVVTQVELHGTTEPQLTSAAGRGSVVLATSPDRERNDKDSLRAFLDHVALAASLPEDEPPHPFAGVVARPSRDAGLTPPQPLVWAPLERAAARAYLTALLGELLSGVHAYLFPCEAVFRSLDGQMSLVDRIDQVRADRFYREQSSSNWGPVPEPFDHPTPDAALAERYATTRFGLWGADRPPPRTRSRKGSS